MNCQAMVAASKLRRRQSPFSSLITYVSVLDFKVFLGSILRYVLFGVNVPYLVAALGHLPPFHAHFEGFLPILIPIFLDLLSPFQAL